MILARVWLLFGIVFAWPAYAQTDAHALEGALRDKQLELKSFSAEPVAHYAWVDGKLVDKPAGVHTLGVFSASSVKLKGQKLSITGVRATLVRDMRSGTSGLSGKSGMEIQIDLNGAEPAIVFPQLRDLLFFPDAATAMAALPAPLARLVPAPLVSKASADPCNCTRFLRDGEWVEVPVRDPLFKQVSVLHTEQPNYTDAARSSKVNGAVRLSLLVDTKGEPSDLWLLNSLGFGLDEAAEQTLAKYKFSPALYDKQPVAVELTIDITFNTF
jgi:TonB family protein